MMYKRLLPLIFQFCILLLVSDETRTDAELLRAGREKNGNNEEGLLSWLTSFGRDVNLMFEQDEETEGEEEQAIFEEKEKALFEEVEKAGNKVALDGDGDVPKYEVYGRDGRVKDILTENEMEQFIKENNIGEKEAALLRGEILVTEEELEEFIKENNVNEEDAELMRALAPYGTFYRSAIGYRGYRGWGYGPGYGVGYAYRSYYGAGYGFRTRNYAAGVRRQGYYGVGK